jgi:glycerate 2-kinase
MDNISNSIIMNFRKIAEEIFLAGVERVQPRNIFSGLMSFKNSILSVGDLTIPVSGKIFVIGAGKASALMGAEVEEILKSNIDGGQIVVKYGYSCDLKYINVCEAGHPVPDSNGFKAAREIVRIAEMAGPGDLVLCLLSGGGSALLSDVPEGCSEEDMIIINDLLVNSGASISEINAVRKHLSGIKGGQLARLTYPATLVSLILSDVTGDSIEVIASGPTVPDSTTFLQALDVLSDYGLMEKVPAGILNYLREGISKIKPETPKSGDPVFEFTYNVLIGTNKMALEAASHKAIEMNIDALIVEDELQGDVEAVADYIVLTSSQFKNDDEEIKPICLLFGGETTVRVNGNGAGGRNQHLALLIAVLLKDIDGVTVLSAGTDGTDGPTDAAGAVVDSVTFKTALAKHIDPEKYISGFDSYNFFKKTGGHIITGPTMTNVMDLIVVLIE